MKKSILFTAVLVSVGALEIQASNAEKWTEEGIRTRLVNQNNFSALDTLEDLLNGGVTLEDIASIFELNKSNVQKPYSILAQSLEDAEKQRQESLTNDLEIARQLAAQWGNQDQQRAKAQEDSDAALARSLAQDLENQGQESFTNDLEIARQLAAQWGNQDQQRAKEQEDSDAMIANALAQEFQKQTLINQSDSDSDFALALDLQNRINSNPGIIKSSDGPPISMKADLFKRVEEAMQIMKTAQDKDVHDFNKSFFGKNKDLFGALQQALQLDLNLPLEPFLDDIRKANTHNPVVAKAITQFKTYNFNDIEPETGLNLGKVLSCIACLAKKLEPLGVQNIYQYIGKQTFAENLETQGGCKAGFGGRFYRDYLYLIRVYLDHAHVNFID